MKNVKKTLNVFGIILAWFVSIALVLMLLVSPIALSLLSLLDAESITNALTSGLAGPSAYVQQEEKVQGPYISKLSATDTDTTGNVDTSQIDPGLLEGILGSTGLDEETLSKLLSTDVAKELIESYTNDMANAITGKNEPLQFNAEKVKEIVNNNMEEIAEVLKEVVPEFADKDLTEIKQQIQQLLDENVDQLINAVPKPSDITNELTKDNPALETALQIIAQKDTIKLAIVGAIVALCVLIFLFRLPGFRGFRWLATVLFIGGGLNAVITAGLFLSTSVIGGLIGDNAAIASIVDSVLSSFKAGMLIRTAVILASAVALLVAYIFIKKACKKKLVAAEEALLTEETVEEAAEETTEEAVAVSEEAEMQ